MASGLDPLSPLLLNGDAPDGWCRRRLGEIAEISGGTTPSRAEERYWGGSTQWATPTDLTVRPAGGLEIATTAEALTRDAIEETSVRILPVNSVLMSSRATIGEVAINTVPMATNQGFCNFVPKEGTNSIFLAQWLAGNRKRLERLAGGSTFLELAKRDAREVQIHLPPLPEQRKIAAILSSVDDAIAGTRKVIDQTKRVKQGLLQTLMTRGIGHTRLRKTEIGAIPVAWTIARMDGIAVPDGMVGGPFGSDLTASDYVDNSGVPVIRGGNVSPGRFHATNFAYVDRAKAERLKRNQAIPGDLVMTQRGASLGQTASIPEGTGFDRFVVSQTMMRMRPDRGRVHPRFLLNYINSGKGQSWLQRNAIATGQPHVNLTIFRRMPVPVPAMSEQEEIANAVGAMEEAERAGVEQLGGLTGLKRGLMQDLLTGRVRVQPD